MKLMQKSCGIIEPHCKQIITVLAQIECKEVLDPSCVAVRHSPTLNVFLIATVVFVPLNLDLCIAVYGLMCSILNVCMTDLLLGVLYKMKSWQEYYLVKHIEKQFGGINMGSLNKMIAYMRFRVNY